MLLLTLLACKESPLDSAAPCALNPGAALVATVSRDYATGSFATVDADTHEVCDQLFVTSGDPGVAVAGDTVYQLNRLGYDNLRAYTPGDWSRPRWERELGDASNPYDAALCQGRLFVSLYGTSALAILDPESGNQVGAVDLGAFADGDGVGPEPAGMVVVDDALYVGMNRLDRQNGWVDTGGAVARVDCATGTVDASWSVAADARVVPWRGGDGVLVAARAFGDAPGGVWTLDGASASLLVDAATLGAELIGVAAYGDHAVLTALSADYSEYGIWCADLRTGSVSSLDTTTDFLVDLAANDRGEAWLAAHWGWQDPDEAVAGLTVYDIETCTARTEAPITLSLAPYALAFL